MNADTRASISDTTIYREALQTYRSTTSAVVTSASGLLTAALVLAGFAVERKSEILLAVAVVPMLAMWTLFRRWQWISRQCAVAANEAESNNTTAALFTDRLDRFMGTDTPVHDRRAKRWFMWPGRSKGPSDGYESYGSAFVVSMAFWAAAAIAASAVTLGTTGWWDEERNLEGLKKNAAELCPQLPEGQTTVEIEVRGLRLSYPCQLQGKFVSGEDAGG